MSNTKRKIEEGINQGIGSFKRIEDKYMVEKSLKKRFLADIYENMEPSYLDSDTEYTLIESIYLDSKKLDLFRHHFQTHRSRYKLRVRLYGPDGVWDKSTIIIELKKKKEGVTKKIRIKIGSAELEMLTQGEEIILSTRIRTLNNSLSRSVLEKRLSKINELIGKFSLRPARSVVYKRYAFENDGFRVTVDSNLKQEIISPISKGQSKRMKEDDLWKKADIILSRLEDQEKCVLELKHTGVVPEWMKGLLEKYGVHKESFSKYCYFTAKSIEES